MDDRVEERDDAGVRVLTLGGGRAHALSRGMIGALHAALDRAAAEEAVRAVVIDGPGSIFCAGHDLREIARHRGDADRGLAYLTDLFEACGAMMQRLATHPKPTLAVVEGIATAAGLQMAASCALVYAGPGARFCLPGVRNGGFCTTPAVAVSRAVGARALADLALTGEERDVAWALRAGLVTEVVEDPRARAMDVARTLAGRNAATLQAGWAAVRAQADQPLDQAYAQATPVMIAHFMDEGRLRAEAAGPFAAQ